MPAIVSLARATRKISPKAIKQFDDEADPARDVPCEARPLLVQTQLLDHP